MAKHGPFDVVVIGSGPGGYVAAIRAGQLGLKVAVVEKDSRFGGTCLLRGCIPTKALLHDAYLYKQVQSASKYGIEIDGYRVNYEKVAKHKEIVVKKLAMGVQGLLKKNKVKTFSGFGKIVRPGVVSVNDTDEIEAKNILLATGSEARWFPGMEPDGKGIVTNREILDWTTLPKSLVVIGAGAVGTEFASIFHRFGVETTLVEALPNITPLEDAEVSGELEKILKKRGINVLTGAMVEAINPGYEVVVSVGGKKQSINAEKVLVAVGRKPNTDGIGLENTRAKAEKGFIHVNEYMETEEPGIYAIGDIVRTAALAHVASAEGILAIDRMAGREVHPINHDRVPNVTYCDPQVASVGLTEKAARERGYDVQCGKFPYMGIGKATIEGESEGFVKIVGEKKYNEVLGIHILHAHAGEMIAEGVAVLNGELTVEALANSIHPHPTLSEAVAEATHAYFGHAIHI
ncbi:MAG: dihydrolipoyl dehydrogenase [Planctomycetota bacterium]|jgi:dihydrolipoamide dehydrogenase|nr:dihydrolipoyl dehydrogenase [Planctomycetota bacterium]